MTGAQAFNILYARPTTLAGSSNSAATQSVDDMASYVWDLEFVTPAPPTPSASDPTKMAPPQMVPWPQGYFWKELPQWVEIHFKALGTTAARKLQGVALTRGAWFPTSASSKADQNIYNHMILPGEQQFVTRVKLCR